MYSVALLLKSIANHLEKKETLTDEEFFKLSSIFSYLNGITRLSKEMHPENLSIALHRAINFTDLNELEDKLWEAYLELRDEYLRYKTLEFHIQIGKVLGWSREKELKKEIKEMLDLIHEAFSLNQNEEEEV